MGRRKIEQEDMLFETKINYDRYVSSEFPCDIVIERSQLDNLSNLYELVSMGNFWVDGIEMEFVRLTSAKIVETSTDSSDEV